MGKGFIKIEKAVQTSDMYMNDLHSHAHYELYFLMKGERMFFLSNAFYKVHAPTLIVIPPHTMHKTEGGAFERYNINVSPSYLDDFQKESLPQEEVKIVRLAADEMREFDDLLRCFNALDPNAPYADYITRTVFSYILYRICHLQDALIQTSKTALLDEETPSVLLKVIDYLDNNYAEKITLDGIAERFFISKARLCTLFKTHTRSSVIDFLLNIRLNHAKKLLTETKKSMEEIADLCGFSSANYFGLLFKQKLGLSPKAYRKYQTSEK